MDVQLPGVKCPTCDAKVKATVEDLAKQRTVRCPSGHAIALKDVGGGARQVNKAHDDLMKTLKNFGK